jgi:hypothetical protein
MGINPRQDLFLVILGAIYYDFRDTIADFEIHYIVSWVLSDYLPSANCFYACARETKEGFCGASGLDKGCISSKSGSLDRKEIF